VAAAAAAAEAEEGEGVSEMRKKIFLCTRPQGLVMRQRWSRCASPTLSPSTQGTASHAHRMNTIPSNPPFPPSFPLYLISREAPSSRALRYGSLASLISLLRVCIYNYTCAIGPWSLNPNRTSLRIAPAASFDGYNSALCYFCCCS